MLTWKCIEKNLFNFISSTLVMPDMILFFGILLIVILTEWHNLLEHTESGSIFANSIELNYVRVFRILKSSHHLIHVFFQHLLIADCFIFTLKWSCWMNKLASLTIWTIHIFMILFAKSSFIPWRNMFFLLKLVIAMSKSAIISEFALSCQLPISTHLSLIFSFKRLATAGRSRRGRMNEMILRIFVQMIWLEHLSEIRNWHSLHWLWINTIS